MNRGYVVTQELARLAGITQATFYMSKNIQLKKAGGISIVKIDSLPGKYKQFIEKCHDITNYAALKQLEDELCINRFYIYNRLYSKTITIPHITFGHRKLYKLSDEFVELYEKKLTPYLIDNYTQIGKDDVVIDMYGLKIGFY